VNRGFDDPTAVIDRCTVQLPNGRFCDARSLEDVPFPICGPHAERLLGHFGKEPVRYAWSPRLAPEHFLREREENHRRFQAQADLRRQRMDDQSQVYYVRIHDHVKIGYSINMRQRLGALRVNDDALLATEPGGREVEAMRHQQFAAERVGRREDFNPSRRLLAHIEAVKAEHGDPKITSWRNGFDADLPQTS
jgi:hypothetical protein